MAYYLQLGFLILYSFVMLTLVIYGLHRYHLIYLYYRNRRNRPTLKERFTDLPRVTLQLPMYNEQLVARRIIEKCCEIDYPIDRFQIQVLDDSTDETVQIASETVGRMKARGHDIVYIHRENREGYKAGALDAGLRSATGEFVAIFDADFVPEPDIIQRMIHFFTDPQVAVVQSRWGHINRGNSLLTETQAILLDGHFVIEHGGRNQSGCFMNFNGTAGIWRKCAIDDAGGWQHDTLTEDLDLSYRAQMKGWKFIYLPDVISPAELPPEMEAFKQQQFRWAKGTAQTAIKLLPKLLRSKLPLHVKVQGFFHLTSIFIYVIMVVLTLMMFPALWIKVNPLEGHEWLAVALDLSLFVLATCAASTFYICSQRELFRNWRDKMKYLPLLMSVGIGISLNSTRAVFEALFGRKSEFVRTPKYGASEKTDQWRQNAHKVRHKIHWMPWLEMAFGFYMLACIAFTLASPSVLTLSLPFLILFAAGYFYVSLSSLVTLRDRRRQREAAEAALAAAEADDAPDA
jgi:cellulose synthase/poly-beta-1,6-N-acetylglucosamine synthase-like glycosyltransferase